MYNLHSLGISESRWTESGSYRTHTGETVLYSGRNDNQHHYPQERTEEVPFGMEAQQQQADEDQNKGKAHQHHHHPVHQPRITRKRARMHFTTGCRLCYGTHHEMKVVMGELNAKVGSDNTNHDRAMEKGQCGSVNNSGFCTT